VIQLSAKLNRVKLGSLAKNVKGKHWYVFPSNSKTCSETYFEKTGKYVLVLFPVTTFTFSTVSHIIGNLEVKAGNFWRFTEYKIFNHI